MSILRRVDPAHNKKMTDLVKKDRVACEGGEDGQGDEYNEGKGAGGESTTRNRFTGVLEFTGEISSGHDT